MIYSTSFASSTSITDGARWRIGLRLIADLQSSFTLQRLLSRLQG